MSTDPPERPLQRLDPDAATPAHAPTGPGRQGQSFSPRRYQWMAGAFGVVLVVVFSIAQLSSHGVGTAGVPAGTAMTPFAAPLAGSSLIGDANLHPTCSAAHHDRRALNTCLLMARGPLVLGFFVIGSSACEQAVSSMQAIAPRFASTGVQFAAVAVRASPSATRAAVRRHHWTIPVAYDRDGAVGQTNGVVVCPLIELVRRGGVVQRRLVGKSWANASWLAGAVQGLAAR